MKFREGFFRFSGKFLGIDYAMLPNCEWNQKQKHKKQPWSNVECFAFGGATVRFASLKTSFHAANHKPKGRFFWYAFGIYKPKEPSLWFVQGQLVYHSQKKSGLPDDEAIPIFEYLRKCM